MKKLITFLLLIAIVACSPVKKINRIYTKHPELRPKDSVLVVIQEKEKIVYRDTVVTVKMPADTVREEGEIRYLPGEPVPIKITPEVITAESEYANAEAWIESRAGKMFLKLELRDKDTTLYFRLDDALKEASYWRTEYEHKTTVVSEPYVPEFWRIFGMIGIGAVVLGLIAVVWRFWVRPR